MVSRSQLWQAQTPQVFRLKHELRKRTRNSIQNRSRLPTTAQLIESLGIPIHVTLSSRRNFKITTRDDLDFATALLTHAKQNEPRQCDGHSTMTKIYGESRRTLLKCLRVNLLLLRNK